MENLNKIIEKYENIPAMPNVIIKALNTIKSEDSSIKDLADIVAYDQALSTQILKLVNSAYYGFPSQITSITKGLALIGMTQSRNIIIVTAMKPMMTTKGGREIWQHSIKCALACEMMAKDLNIMDPSEAFAVGFLHDIGKVVLCMYQPEKFAEIQQKVINGQDGLALENLIFGMTHVNIGVNLAKKWQLPVLLINSIKYHHNPTNSSMQNIASLVYVADKITHDYEKDVKINENILKTLELTNQDIEELQMAVNIQSESLLKQLN